MASGKFTLIEMVQKVLEALGSDEVNSISDTVEATQVARLLEDTFYELLNQKEWPFLKQLIQLDAVADSTRPTVLRIPDNVVRIDEFRYDCTDRVTLPLEQLDIQEVCWMEPEDFIRKVQARNTDQTNVVEVMTVNGIRIPIINDTCPKWWTSFDDEFVITDGYDSTIESTLQNNRSQVLAKVIPDFQLLDTYVPRMPSHLFQTWLAEAKATAFIYWRQEVSPKDEQRARRGLAVFRRDASRTSQDDGKVKFGRRPFHSGFSGPGRSS
jgi:hypothetical protein